MKTCFKCGVERQLSDFYKHGAMADGHLNKCKECTKIDVRKHRIDNPEKVRSYDRGRSNLPHRLELKRKMNEKYKREHPERKPANNALNNAVRDGKMVKGSCVFCGSSENIEGHHHDYAKHLDVTWLCKPCHSRFHALERMATYNL